MDDLTAAYRAAREVAAAWRPESAPRAALPLGEMVAAAGVDVAHFRPSDHPDVQGFLDPEEPLIWLAEGQAPEAERFSLAHEFGHWRLHRRDGDHCRADDLVTEASLAPEEAYSPRSRRERQANAFAAELLAPSAAVADLFLGRGTEPQSVSQIARRLNVSLAVIQSQLLRLLRAGQAEDGADHTAAPERATPDALDPSQARAATAATPALVVAGPGTGKTSTLVARIAWLVEERGVDPAAVLALTFSRKAAEEMRERVARRLGADNVQPTITTFHSFGADTLRAYGHLVGLRPDFRLIDEIGAFFALRDLGAKLPLEYYASLGNPTQHFGALLAAISKAKDELAGPERYAELARRMAAAATTPDVEEDAARAGEVAAVYRVYQAELARRGDVDFGDLVALCVRLLDEQPEVRDELTRRYQHIIVDEFQDINRANGVLLRRLTGTAGRIWAVGDTNQTIYRFRGASPANIDAFAADYPGAQTVTLDFNYRSRPAIVAAANRFATAQLARPGAPPTRLAATRPAAGPAVRLRVAPDGAAELADLVAGALERHEAGVAWREMAVLCRTRALARRVAAALVAAGAPATTRSDAFDNPQFKDWLGLVHLAAGESGGVLRAGWVPDHAVTPLAAREVLRVAASASVGFEEATAQVIAAATTSGGDRAGLERLRGMVALARARTSVALALTDYAFRQTDIGRRALIAGGDRAAHLGELLLLARRFDEERRPSASDSLSPADATRLWREFLTFLLGARTLTRGAAVADEGATKSIRVLTVHAAKGLEWPVVFLPELAAGRFPSRRQGARAPLPPGLTDEPAADLTAAHLTEEACLFFVAITRARDTLILSRSERLGKTNSKPSPFLAPLLASEDVAAEAAPAAPHDDIVTEARTEIMPGLGAELLTAGALATYDRCPRQFAYRYGFHVGQDHDSYGRMIRAVSHALRVATAERADVGRAVALFDERWLADPQPEAAEIDPFADLYQRQGRDAVAAGIERVVASAPAADVAFAREVLVRVAETPVRVALDRVEGEPGTTMPIAIRHVLGRKRAAPALDLRHYLFLLALRQTAGDGTLREHRLATNELLPVPLTPTIEAKIAERALAAVAGIQRGAFPAQPDPMTCAGCSFALLCSMT